MRELDETDMEILSLLAEDARRPFSSIGDEVGLSGPAVSDRVQRVEEAKIINGFTIDVNRAQLGAGIPVSLASLGLLWPVLAAGAMAFSSVSVLSNSLLFRRYTPDHDYKVFGRLR